jgi:ribosome maturation factor RimP
METKDKIMELVSAPIAEAGFELIDIKLARYRKESRLQLFIDSDNGVKIDDCVRISRLVGPIFDNSGLFKFGYGLEVSSPGLDRPLETARDFRRRVGETVEIYFNDKKLPSARGELVSADDRFIEIRTEGGLDKYDLMDVRKGKIIV